MNIKALVRSSVIGAAMFTFSFSVSANFGSSGNGGQDMDDASINGVYLTNNSYIAIAKRFVTDAVDEAAENTADDLDSVSGITSFANTKNESGDSCYSTSMEDRYDVCVLDHDYGDNGFRGWNSCQGTTSGSHPDMECPLSLARINLHHGNDGTRGHTVCHEVGHGLGLRHTSDSSSCVMRSADGGTSETYSTHDKNHLTTEY